MKVHLQKLERSLLIKFDDINEEKFEYIGTNKKVNVKFTVSSSSNYQGPGKLPSGKSLRIFINRVEFDINSTYPKEISSRINNISIYINTPLIRDGILILPFNENKVRDDIYKILFEFFNEIDR